MTTTNDEVSDSNYKIRYLDTSCFNRKIR